MLALVLDGRLRVDPDYPEPRRLPGEAMVEVPKAGICDTDLQLSRGYMVYRGVLGHEFVGHVVQAWSRRPADRQRDSDRQISTCLLGHSILT